jgi:hypothetical protein
VTAGSTAPASGPAQLLRDVPPPAPRFDHLARLTHDTGIWEHTRFGAPRTDHGSCTDDAARAVVVGCAAAADDVVAADLAERAFGFVTAARSSRGVYRNRCDSTGRWLDERGPDDTQGRAWWALGTAARSGPSTAVRERALDLAEEVAVFSSPYLRANATAVLGAAELVLADPEHAAGTAALLRCSDAIAVLVRARRGWPEPTLAYDNARIPEALLAAGGVLGDEGLQQLGLDLLGWLVAEETRGDHFSFAPAGGRPVGGSKPGFDQQPIEGAAMASACARAWRLTGDRCWGVGADRAARWFLGANDVGVALYDPGTGATYDGLEPAGVNRNRGAESTLSGLEALLAARTTGPVHDTDPAEAGS